MADAGHLKTLRGLLAELLQTYALLRAVGRKLPIPYLLPNHNVVQDTDDLATALGHLARGAEDQPIPAGQRVILEHALLKAYAAFTIHGAMSLGVRDGFWDDVLIAACRLQMAEAHAHSRQLIDILTANTNTE